MFEQEKLNFECRRSMSIDTLDERSKERIVTDRRDGWQWGRQLQIVR